MKHISADVPEDLLREAMAVTNKGVAETLTAGLELVRRTRAYQKAMDLRGSLDLDVSQKAEQQTPRSSVVEASWGALRMEPLQVRKILREEDGLLDA